MSWGAYVRDFLVRPGQMDGAGIYGLDGGEWAVEGNVRPNPYEVSRLIAIIKGCEQDFNSIKINGVGYVYLSHDCNEGSIRLKRLKAPESEKYSIVGYLSNQCFVFGVVCGNHQVGNCCKFSCKLRDYLKEVGY